MALWHSYKMLKSLLNKGLPAKTKECQSANFYFLKSFTPFLISFTPFLKMFTLILKTFTHILNSLTPFGQMDNLDTTIIFSEEPVEGIMLRVCNRRLNN